jgi:hypothetical protein
MTKRPSLSSALREAQGQSAPPKTEASSSQTQASSISGSKLPPSRQGKKAITGYFDPAVSKQLKRLALEQDKTVQDLLGEGLNELFTKYGQNPIA